MNYTNRHKTHASPRKVELSSVYITSNPRLNEVRLERLLKQFAPKRIPISVRYLWYRYQGAILNQLAIAFIAFSMALFIIAYLIWA